MTTLLFYLFSLLVLLSAYFVVTVHNLFRAAMGLIALLGGIAGLYLMMNAQFLSAVQITVYVGGIVVLIVYVVLLVADAAQSELESPNWRKGAAAVLATVMFLLLLVGIRSHDFGMSAEVEAASASTRDIGRALLSPERHGFVVPFELISLVLVAAIVGAITVARGPSENEADNNESQT